jgi:colanic acid/amylovoran biosynthesis glycosyltransferase
MRFFKLELGSHGDWIRSLKNLIINIHIIGKPLDWIHFGFATTALGRENLAWAMGVQSAVSFRGFDIGLYPHQHQGCYELLWQRIDKVHTISEDLYQKALELGLDSNIPFNKITPAINIEFFQSGSLEDIHKPLRILTVGRLTWQKGYEYALKALRLLRDKQIDFEYHIVGDGNYREAIIYAIHQLKLTDNVILKGQLSPEGVKKEMEWADIYIQPSIQEGFCNAVLEAQSMGLLCIVSDADGLSENVLDGKTGWVVKKRNPISIFKKIISIIDTSVNKLNKVKTNSKNRVLSNFNIYLQHDQWAIFFNE